MSHNGVSMSTTHVCCMRWNAELERLQRLNQYVMFVTPEWLIKCIQDKVLHDEAPYEVKPP